MQRIDRPEAMDRPDADPEELAHGLDCLAQINGWLGGWWSVRQVLSRGLPRSTREGALLLDVGTGAGDIARRVARRWRKQRLRIVALDRHPVTLSYARRHAGGGTASPVEKHPGPAPPGPVMGFVQGDALRLPFRSDSLDVALCSLTLHHFAEEEAVRVLSELKRVARRAVVVTDLRRSGSAWLLIWLLTRLVWRSRIVRSDGPASVLRAYTPGELRGLAGRAGLRGARILRQPFFRMALLYVKTHDGA